MNQQIIDKFTDYLAALPEQDAFAALDNVLKVFLSIYPGHIVCGSDDSTDKTVEVAVKLIYKHDLPEDIMAVVMTLLIILPGIMIEFADLGELNPQIQDLKDTMQEILDTLQAFHSRAKDHLQTVS